MPLVEREICLENGPPWGFRLIDNNPGLEVAKVRPGSVAEAARLHEGDVVTKINDVDTRNIAHAEAVELIEMSKFTLKLTVNRHESRHVEKFTLSMSAAELVAEDAQVGVSVEIPVNENDKLIIPFSPDVEPVALSKLQQLADPTPYSPLQKKKVYCDSSFYGEKNLYPTVEEQVQIAKKVANSLTDQLNKSSRGAAMFFKRRNRAHKWTKKAASDSDSEEHDDADSDKEDEVEHHEVAVPVMYGADLETTITDDTPLPIPPPPPIPPAPCYPSMVPEYRHTQQNQAGKIPPPPNLPFDAPRSEKEFIEKLKSYPRSKHNTVAPEKCFDIAQALHNCDSRGAQIFNKRRQRAKKWEIESETEAHQQNFNANGVGKLNPMVATNMGPSPHKMPNSPLSGNTYSQSSAPKPKITSKLLPKDTSVNPGSGWRAVEFSPPHSPAINSSGSASSTHPLHSQNPASLGSSLTTPASPLTPQSQSSSSQPTWRPVTFNVPSKSKSPALSNVG